MKLRDQSNMMLTGQEVPSDVRKKAWDVGSEF